MMQHARRLAVMVAVLAVGAVSGCTMTVPGRAQSAGSALRSLPTEQEISDAVGNPLMTYGFRPFVGGLDIMPDGFRTEQDADPIRCAGVTETMLRRTYAPDEPVDAARQSYFNLDRGLPVSGADVAAVVLTSDAQADKPFDAFVRDWRSCDGQTVVKHLHRTPDDDVVAAIDKVVVAGAMLSASVTTRQGAGSQAYYARAVAMRGSTIVEVSLAVSAQASPGLQSAQRVAAIMLDKSGLG
jgi:hypothetical protein